MTFRDILGDLVAIIHAGFVIFVIVGFVLIVAGELIHWRWVRNAWIRSVHLAAVMFTVVRVWLAMTCPLWILEDRVRGSPAPIYDRVTQWCHRLCFRGTPHRDFQIKVTIFAALVLAQMILTLASQHRAGKRSMAME